MTTEMSKLMTMQLRGCASVSSSPRTWTRRLPLTRRRRSRRTPCLCSHSPQTTATSHRPRGRPPTTPMLRTSASLTVQLTLQPASPRRVIMVCLKPGPHQQQRRSNTVECYKSNDSFDKVEYCFDNVALFGNNAAGFCNNVERNLSFRQSRN